MMRMIEKMLAPVKRRLRLMVTLGVVKLINDATTLQELQITALDEEVLDGVERIQQYGFTAHPHPDADCLILNVGDNRAHPIVIAVDDRRYRLTLAEGEAALYDDLGQSVKLLRSGIVIEAAAGMIINGDVTLNGTLTSTGNIFGAGISLNTHTHPGDSGGITGAPQ